MGFRSQFRSMLRDAHCRPNWKKDSGCVESLKTHQQKENYVRNFSSIESHPSIPASTLFGVMGFQWSVSQLFWAKSGVHPEMVSSPLQGHTQKKNENSVVRSLASVVRGLHTNWVKPWSRMEWKCCGPVVTWLWSGFEVVLSHRQVSQGAFLKVERLWERLL